MSKEFIDSNVIVYANDAAAGDRQSRSIDLVTRLLEDGSGVISTQVLMEYAAVATRKLNQSRTAITRQTLILERFEVIPVTGALIRNGMEIAERYRISFWDSVILAAADAARCTVLWSQDFEPGARYVGITVRSPFQE